MKRAGIRILLLLWLCVMVTACGKSDIESSDSQELTDTEQLETITPEETQTENQTEEGAEDVTEEAGADLRAKGTGDSGETDADLSEAFYAAPISEEIKERITGISYPDYEPYGISYDELRYVHVLHYNLDHEVKEGELICNQLIAEDLVEIFQELFEQEYPIERICLVDDYNGDDETSMRDNNTSCFNYRVIAGTSSLSNHSFGLAIDINPLYNPYVSGGYVQPSTGAAYADRSGDFPYKIDREDICYQLFTEHGFTWGGDWSSPKDYQHFEYVR